MPGLVPGIHVFAATSKKGVDGRDPSPPRLRRATIALGRRSFREDGEPGHDVEERGTRVSKDGRTATDLKRDQAVPEQALMLSSLYTLHGFPPAAAFSFWIAARIGP